MIEPDLIAALSPLVGGRVFYGVAPNGTQRPYLTLAQAGGRAVSTLGRDVATLRNARIQVDTWASSAIDANTLALQIEDTLRVAPAFSSVEPVGGFVSEHVPELGLHRARQDFSIWQPR